MSFSRRSFLSLMASSLPLSPMLFAANGRRPKIAALTTIYHKYSHSQHIVDRFLEGYGWQGRHHKPAMDLVSLYVEQKSEVDLSHEREHRYPGLWRAGQLGQAASDLGGQATESLVRSVDDVPVALDGLRLSRKRLHGLNHQLSHGAGLKRLMTPPTIPIFLGCRPLATEANRATTFERARSVHDSFDQVKSPRGKFTAYAPAPDTRGTAFPAASRGCDRTRNQDCLRCKATRPALRRTSEASLLGHRTRRPY